MIFLGISGKRGSGKSTLAKFLEFDHNFATFSLADELKREVMRDWGLKPSMLWGKDKEIPTGYTRRHPIGHPLTARDIMIRHGEYRRGVDELYWVRKFNPELAERIVCDDIRFMNEVRYFKENFGAKFVRIERKPELNVFKGALDDLSENELDGFKDWDFVLPAEENVNENDLKAFAARIAKSL